MTPDEKNKRLAKLLGWKGLEPGNKRRPRGIWVGTPPGDVFHKPIPDYCQDLNAAWEVEEQIWKERSSNDYLIYLDRVMRNTPGCHPRNGQIEAIHATAEQRVDALILTLEQIRA